MVNDPFGAVLVDYSWLLARAYHAMKRQNLTAMVDGERVYTGDAFRTLQDVVGLKRAAPEAKVLLCIDWKTDEGTYTSAEGSEEYKADRVGPKPMFEKYDEVLALACMLDDVYVAGAYGAEADEVIVSLAAKLSSRGERVLMFARDKDLCQAVSGDRVVLVGKVSGGAVVEQLDEDGVVEKYGCPPSSMAMYQAIVGDKVDGVVRYPRFMSKYAALLARKYPEPRLLLERQEGELDAKAERQAKKLDGWREQLEANFKLTDMRLVPERVKKIEVFRPPPRPDLVELWRLNSFADALLAQSDARGSFRVESM